jgi:hypothetical protein
MKGSSHLQPEEKKLSKELQQHKRSTSPTKQAVVWWKQKRSKKDLKHGMTFLSLQVGWRMTRQWINQLTNDQDSYNQHVGVCNTAIQLTWPQRVVSMSRSNLSKQMNASTLPVTWWQRDRVTLNKKTSIRLGFMTTNMDRLQVCEGDGNEWCVQSLDLEIAQSWEFVSILMHYGNKRASNQSQSHSQGLEPRSRARAKVRAIAKSQI